MFKISGLHEINDSENLLFHSQHKEQKNRRSLTFKNIKIGPLLRRFIINTPCNIMVRIGKKVQIVILEKKHPNTCLRNNKIDKIDKCLI